MTKKCPLCEKVKPVDEFYKHKLTQDGFNTYCKDCCNKKSKEYRQLKPRVLADAKKKWKIDHSDRENINNKGHNFRKYWPDCSTIEAVAKYEELLKTQENKCAICFRHQDEMQKSLHVDHNHSTGKVRGLLCFSCNSILGHCKEDKEILVRTVEYIERDE